MVLRKEEKREAELAWPCPPYLPTTPLTLPGLLLGDRRPPVSR